MPFDYSKLRGRIVEKCQTSKVLADKIGLSAHSLSLKLNNKLFFKQNEMILVAEVLEFPIEEIPAYFFTKVL